MIWAEAINDAEFLPLKDKITTMVGPSNIATVRLHCTNPVEIITGDTRTPITQCKTIITYRLQDSTSVADYIFNNREVLASVG
jgi:hypothetical protein